MINRLMLKNVGPYESADVAFDDFATILGPNGSGKSVLFSALKAVGRVAKFPLRSIDSHHPSGYQTRTGHVGFDDIVHRRDLSREIVLSVEFSARDVEGKYEVHLRHWQNPAGVLVEERL